MDSPVRVQIRRGVKLPPNTLSVARPTVWGNPFRIGEASGVFDDDGPVLIPALSREQCVEFYRKLVQGVVSPEMHPHAQGWQATWRKRIKGHPIECIGFMLGRRNLACYCLPGVACHADVLLELANPGLRCEAA